MSGLTRIEMDAMRTIESINRKMKDQREIDWEQRRYETARDAMCAIITSPHLELEWKNGKNLAQMAMGFADALINELKGGSK